MIQFILNKDLLIKEYPWIKHNYKSNNMVYLFISKQSCLHANGINCTIDNHNTTEEIPMEALMLPYENFEYEIIMTENLGKTDVMYLKKSPFNRLDILSQIQNKAATKNGAKDVLKITIKNGSIQFKQIAISDIEPLF
jgi:hypothetical protein